MTQIRAMAVFQGGSELPEDQFVNTWHFVTPGADSAADQAAVAAVVGDFYRAVPSLGGPDTVGMYLSPYCLRSFTIKTYDLADAMPREPTEFVDTLPAATSSNGLPAEVACCLSFQGGPPVTAHRRGRLYIGPLAVEANDPASSTTPARVSTSLRNALRTAAFDVRESGTGWSIFSPTTGLFSPVVTGHVDDAFDTQRRRGVAPSGRLSIPAA